MSARSVKRNGVQPWIVAYQSKGQKPGEWLGPFLDDIIKASGASGVEAIVVSPIGFVTDHMETLYDLDIVAEGEARDAGVGFVRSAVPNADDRLVQDVARAIRAAASS